MSKKSLSKILMSIIFLGIIWILPNTVKANTLTISESKTTLVPGQSTTITVSSDSIGRVNLSVSGNATITGDRVWLEGNSQSFTLTATGSGTVTLTATPENPMSLNGNKVDLSPTSCTINVSSGESSSNNSSNSNNNQTQTQTQTPTKSNVATLSNLGITPNDFSGFTPSNTCYSVTVPNNVSSVEVYAKKGQSGQTVSGTGKKNLQEGTNTFNVVVTAEDGKTKKTYTINVTRKAAEKEETETNNTTENNTTNETEKDEEQKEETKPGLSTLKIAGITLSPAFNKDVHEYTVKLIGDKTSLDIDTKALEESEKIEIVGNENLQEGENIITIFVSNEAGENPETYQITVNKSLVDEEAVEREKQAEEKEKQKRLLIIGITIAAIIIIAIIIIIRHRRNRQYEMEYTEPYNEGNWENQNNNQDSNSFQGDIEQPKQKEIELNNQIDEFEDKPKKRKPKKGKRFK